MTVSQAFLLFDDLESSVVLVRYFVQCLSISICIMFFSWLEWVMGFWQEDHRGKMPFLLCHIRSTCCQHVLLLMLAFVRLSTLKLLFCPLSYCILWKEKQPHTKKKWRVMFYFPEVGIEKSYLELFCMRDLSLLSQLFIQSCLYICVYSGIFILYFEL